MHLSAEAQKACAPLVAHNAWGAFELTSRIYLIFSASDVAMYYEAKN